MSPTRKTRRKKKRKCSFPTIQVPEEGAGFKDTDSNGIYVNGSMPEVKDHILVKDFPDNNVDEDALLNQVLSQNVGVNRSKILTEDILKKVDLNYLKIELMQLWKKSRRVNTYRNIAFKNMQSIFKKDACLETFSVKEVYHILYFITHKTVPSSLLGSKRNFKVFMRSAKRVVYGCHKQCLSLSSMVHGLKVSDIVWLQKALPSNSLRLNVLACLVKWLICWVQTIIRQVCYVTTNASNEILFYKKQKWNQTRVKAFQNLLSQGNIVRTQEGSVERERISNIGSIRFLPKSSGTMRPISYFRKPQDTQVLQLREDARILLTQLAYQNGSIGTLFSPSIDETMRQGLLRIAKCHPDPSTRPRYFFVRVDVKDAFGSVNHFRMLKILKDLQNRFLPHDYKLRKWKMQCGRKRVMMFESEKICLPKGWYKSQHPLQIQDLIPILTHIRNSVHQLGLKIGKHVYRIKHGIPQGMHLSTILSEIYYSTLDVEYFMTFQQTKNDELFLRYCDDYLFVTSSEERARQFLNKISAGFPDFNFQINPDKTQTNLNSDTSIVSFCGFIVDVQILSVQASFESYRNLNISHTLSLSQSRKLGRVLALRVKRVLKLNLLLLDKRLNSKHAISQNIYHAALLMAFRFCAFIRSTFPKTRMNQKFILACVKYGERSVRRRVFKAIAHTSPGNWMSLHEAKWIVYRAFLARMNVIPYGFVKVRLCLQKWCDLISRKLNKHQINLLTRVTTPPLPGVFSTMK